MAKIDMDEQQLAVKYHINPKTGNAGKCIAKRFCPFGDLVDDHYTSRESANSAFEAKQQVFKVSGKDILKNLKKRVIRKQDLDYDTITHELDYIHTWEKPWTAEEESNMEIVNQISSIVEREPFTEEDELEARGLIGSMRPYIRVPRRGGWSSDDTSWRARDKMIDSLANSLVIRRLADDFTHKPAEPEDNPRLLGLQAAQDLALKNFNHPDSDFYNGPYLGAVEPHFQEAIARVKRGDAPAPESLLGGADQRSLFPDSERIFNTLHPESEIYDQKMYLAAVYPVNELKEEMDRAGLDNVSVSSLVNGREWGNVYTVIQPDGKTRSFSVYEHRNTDSIIINGSENWNGEGLPYAGEKKSQFFAEFGPDDRKRSAQALTFYMMQAQSGTLEQDSELVAKASHRDWNAILDKSIPGFKAWRQSKITDTYIAPQDESEEDILHRLSF